MKHDDLPDFRDTGAVAHADSGATGLLRRLLCVDDARMVDDQDPPSSIEAVSLAAAPFLTRGVELVELLGALIDAVVQQLDAEKGTLYLVDGAAGMVMSVVTDVPGGIRLAIGQGLAGAVAKDGVVVNVGDAASDPRFHPATDLKTGFKTRSVLAVPVKDAGGENIGVLQLLNARAGVFSPAAEAQALLLARQAGSVLERTSLYSELKRRSPLSSDRPGLAFRFNQIVGESEPMRTAYSVVEKAARTDATVLITGESGTGKELFARAIHMNSVRRARPFVKVDCTTLPEALIENELFGHEKGAFTGADKTTAGKFEVAAGGTLFIDEIGELPLKLQGKLLRVLQDREFERVGGTKIIAADVRIVCATHRDLPEMVEAGLFREDLYYRIKVVPLPTPPLRDRGAADLLRLVEHFVSTFSRRHRRPNVRISEAAILRLKAHPFPGNIRELEHVIESAVVMCDSEVIEPRDLALADRKRPTNAATTTTTASSAGARAGDPDLTLEALEKEHIRLVLEAVKGNQSEAARRLGIGRNTLARKLSGEPE
ncbi:MAG: sigma-54-dependent Fis family transcriptional regulator [Deltaproteobacteria bacterium]|nr:sigma-54-dependent Fis family transcriptional regulator [Deltaproteobacteria bacterium]